MLDVRPATVDRVAFMWSMLFGAAGPGDVTVARNRVMARDEAPDGGSGASSFVPTRSARLIGVIRPAVTLRHR